MLRRYRWMLLLVCLYGVTGCSKTSTPSAESTDAPPGSSASAPAGNAPASSSANNRAGKWGRVSASGTQAVLELRPDGTCSMTAGTLTTTGTYVIAGDQITISGNGGTLKAHFEGNDIKMDSLDANGHTMAPPPNPWNETFKPI